MLKYMIKMNYSSASWARMLTATDDRTSVMAALLDALGGKLESVNWEVEDAAAWVTCYLPDQQSAAAAILASTRTGGYKDVQVFTLLSQEQLSEAVALAKHASGMFHPPGAAAAETDF